MDLAFVTDELSRDPRQAIEMALEWGIQKFELRNIHSARFPRVGLGVLDNLIALREEFSIEYTAVSPGFFKCRLDDQEALDYAFGDGLELCMDFMESCETSILICFGFEMDPPGDDQAVARLQDLGDRLADRSLSAAVENETHCKFNTPGRIAHLLRQVGRPNVGANWDLGNLKQGAQTGFPQGYEIVKPFIFNVHVKDVAPAADGTMEWKPIGSGICDWQGQVDAIVRDQVVDHLTIESHCGPPESVGLANVKALRGYLGC